MSKPKSCSRCGIIKNKLDLSNNGIYNRDLINWEWICHSCHAKKDGWGEKMIKMRLTPWNKGKHLECMQKEKNPNWKGGISLLPDYGQKYYQRRKLQVN